MAAFSAEHILVIGGHAASRQHLAENLREQGYRVSLGVNAAATRRLLEGQPADLTVVDYPWPAGFSGQTLPPWATDHPLLALLDDQSDMEAVLSIMQLGAAECLVKPVTPDDLAATVRRLIDNALLYRSGAFYTHVLRQEAPSLLVGGSASLQALLDTLNAVAPTDATVLIQGESGVGKENVAQEIHRLSLRTRGPLVVVDCCALQETLFESELFGHERGAFTGAIQRKHGLIEQARGGTLFLDEIGEVPLPIQAKLLRVLETKRFRRLGALEDIEADIRFVAATHRDLETMAQQGSFRQDLWFRLNAFAVTVPPLRERREDILPLARHFLSYPARSSHVAKRLSESAQQALLDYAWPGNVRELRNVMERAVILSGNKLRIDAAHLSLPSTVTKPSSEGVQLAFEYEPTLAEIERRYVQLLLERHQGRRAAVAKVLGIGERTLYRMLANSKRSVTNPAAGS